MQEVVKCRFETIFALILLLFVFLYIVPTPNVSISLTNTQILGQSLTLHCEVTTVRGITTNVNIVWRSNGETLRRNYDVSSTTGNNSLVYTDTYTISLLSSTDDGRVINCEVVIDGASPSVVANENITLDVTSEYINKHYYNVHTNCYCSIIHQLCIIIYFI